MIYCIACDDSCPAQKRVAASGAQRPLLIVGGGHCIESGQRSEIGLGYEGGGGGPDSPATASLLVAESELNQACQRRF